VPRASGGRARGSRDLAVRPSSGGRTASSFASRLAAQGAAVRRSEVIGDSTRQPCTRPTARGTVPTSAYTDERGCRHGDSATDLREPSPTVRRGATPAVERTPYRKAWHPKMLYKRSLETHKIWLIGGCRARDGVVR